MRDLEYVELHSQESFGAADAFGIKILVAATKLPDLTAGAITSAVYKAADTVAEEVRAQIIAESPEKQEQARTEKESLLALFPGSIFAEEIPNGYCSASCCRHRPWFVVTTKVGRFTIGWRKRVIRIDWSQTVGTKTAQELFSEESTTKGEKMIHAWSLQDAQLYITELLLDAGALNG